MQIWHPDIDEVILVGGQTRTPKVQEAVSKFFGEEPRRTSIRMKLLLWVLHQAGVGGDVKDVLLLDVTPLCWV